VTQTFHLVATSGAAATLYLTESARTALGRPHLGRVTVCHGARRAEAAVVSILEIGRYLPISAGLSAALGTVDGVPYRLRWVDGELRIGPVIGIHAAARSALLDPAPGGMLDGYLLRYPDVAGLAYLFATDGIDLATEMIEGYYWQPDPSTPSPGEYAPDWERARKLSERVVAAATAEAMPLPTTQRTERFRELAREFYATVAAPAPVDTRAGAGRLVPGRFPFPAALWRRNGWLPQAAHERLCARLGPRLYNSHFFDKQEGYRLLAADPTVAAHLPATRPFTHLGDLVDLLDQEGRAILKRQDGNSGYGLIRIERTEQGFTLRYRERPDAEESFPTAEVLGEHLAPLAAKGGYLLQQCVDLPVFQGRPVDFRIMMQKDHRGRWTPAGMLGRFGRSGAVVTNFINSGYALRPDEALVRAFGVDWREAFRLKSAMLEFAAAVCAALDRTGGCYGDLGLDVALDRERRLWLFEINKLPFHELPLYMGDEQTYLAVKSGPLLYGAYLAGFGGRHREG